MVERWWRWVYPVVLIGLAGAIPLLLWFGWSAINESSDGTEVDLVGDPLEPGFEAFVDPTPSMLVIHGDDADLYGVAVLALADQDVGGTVLFLPPDTVTPVGSLRELWSASGADGVETAASQLLDARPGEVQVLDDAGWAAVVTPTAPIAVSSPDPLVDATGRARFPAGLVPLGPADVGPFLGWRNPSESPTAGSFRSEIFWTAWLDAVAVSTDPAVIPGEFDRGVGRFGRALASGGARYEALPAQVDGDRVVPDAQALAAIVAEMLPFPVAATPGARPRVRLLNGVGDQNLTVPVARTLTAAGAEIVVIGNAAAFDRSFTTITYHGRGLDSAAEAFRAALGTGTVDLQVDEEQIVDIDITVTFGRDVAS